MRARVRGTHRAATTRALVALTLVGGVAGCSNTTGADAAGSGADGAGADGAERTDRVAEPLVQVTSVHEETGMTLLEGPTRARTRPRSSARTTTGST